jgi:hypothetical protein
MLELGMVVEFRTPKYWVVALALRADLDSHTERLDELARVVIDRRDEVLTKELQRAMTVSEPGQVLNHLAASNPWSLSISLPKKKQVSLNPEGTAEQAAQEATLAILVGELEEQRAYAGTKPTANRAARASIWMQTPKTFFQALLPVRQTVSA